MKKILSLLALSLLYVPAFSQSPVPIFKGTEIGEYHLPTNANVDKQSFKREGELSFTLEFSLPDGKKRLARYLLTPVPGKEDEMRLRQISVNENGTWFIEFAQ